MSRNENDRSELLSGVTRAELREAEEANEPGWLARTRKASMAGACALATSLSAGVLLVTQDGALATEELVGTLIVSLGVGASTWLATWAIPNA